MRKEKIAPASHQSAHKSAAQPARKGTELIGHKIKDLFTRRSFLRRSAALSAASGGALALPSLAQAQEDKTLAKITLTMQSSWEGGTFFHELAKQYVDRVNQMAGGRLEIKLLAAGARVPANKVQEACHRGDIDAGHSVSAYWYGKSRAAALFGNGPVFGANGHQILAWMQYGGGKALYDKLVQEKLNYNLVGFFCMPMPAQPLGWFKAPVESASQLEGVNFRALGLAGQLMEKLGVKAVPLSPKEIKPAFESGMIDAFELNNPSADREMGAQDLTKTYMMGSYHQPAEFFEITFNRDKFNALPEDLRAICTYAAEAASTANYGQAVDRYAGDLQKLVEEDGVKLHKTPRDILDRQLKAWDEIIAQLAAKDPFFKEVVESQKAWARRVAYYELMNTPDYQAAYDHYFPAAKTDNKAESQ